MARNWYGEKKVTKEDSYTKKKVTRSDEWALYSKLGWMFLAVYLYFHFVIMGWWI